MERRRLLMVAVPLALVLSAAAFGYTLVGERAPPPARKPAQARKTLADACGSSITYDRLKARLFSEAADVRGVSTGPLDLLAGSTVVRVEEPLTKARDDSLGVTVCTGEFVIELPPGAEEAFGGRRRISAEVEYAAQTAADGSGLVYHLRGAEPIIYRLASIGLSEETSPILAEQRADQEPILDPGVAVVPPLVKVADEPFGAIAPEPPKAAEKAEPEEPKSKLSPKKQNVKKTVAVKGKSTAADRKTAKEKAAKETAAKVSAAKKTAIDTQSAREVVEKRKTEKAAAVAAKAAKKKAAADRARKLAEEVAKTAPRKAVSVSPVRMPKTNKVLKPAAGQRKSVAASCQASTRAAQFLCSNPVLAAKERRTTSLYYSALENADREAARLLRQTAGNFSAYLAGCSTEACVSQAYDGRAQEIRDILADMR